MFFVLNVVFKQDFYNSVHQIEEEEGQFNSTAVRIAPSGLEGIAFILKRTSFPSLSCYLSWALIKDITTTSSAAWEALWS